MNISFFVDKRVFIEVPTYRNPTAYRSFIEEFLQFLCKRIIYRIHEILDRRLYNWVPLSKSYIKYKRKMRLSLRTWVASGQLYNSITYWKNSTGTGFYIGVNPRAYHNVYRTGGTSSKKSKVKLTTIIGRLEYGTARIPARPLFRPVFKEFQKDLRRHYQDYLQLVKDSMEGEPMSKYHPETFATKDIKREENSPLNPSNIKFKTGQSRKNMRSVTNKYYGKGVSSSENNNSSHHSTYALSRSSNKRRSVVQRILNRNTPILQRTRTHSTRQVNNHFYSKSPTVSGSSSSYSNYRSVNRSVVTNRLGSKKNSFYSNIMRFTNRPSILYNK